MCEKDAVRVRVHPAPCVLIGGLVNAGLFDPQDTGCIQNMWTSGGSKDDTCNL